ncbi:hypothetical protein BKA65DRAFT_390158 [Rhexocercosporidium sp. MPI-PUGE-AT-0058]|nr:hypothetical protein BKA65DRAFT_390158 [Rhexocercosporidium sp. MPI-PUGE-AT-0058]
MNCGSWTPYPLSKLISLLLEPICPAHGIRQTLHLSQLLLLSNHLSQANTLLSSIYTHGPSIIPPSQHEESTVPTTLPLEAFWLTHPSTHPRPENAPPICTPPNQTVEERLEFARWGKFRECTLTGWMLEHCNLREPKYVHCWRESEDPKMLAMCSRLLAKTKVRGTYVSTSRMREALDAALKLYALPEKKGENDGSKEARYRRHSSLLYRRLPIELAIRLGELDTASAILSDALCKDGFCDGGTLEGLLFLPGIWDVLPLLNKKGREGNAYFIKEEDANVLVKGVVGALELRAKEGRQWSLAPEKVGWKELLERLARGSWKVNKREYREQGVFSWRGILNEPASQEEIEEAEEQFGELPRDFKDMCRVANGFKGGWHFLAGGIAGIDSMFFDAGETELYHFDGDFYPDNLDLSQEEHHDMLQLECGTESDGFRHYIIPHDMWKGMARDRDVGHHEYRYCHMTNWSASVSHWATMWDWVASLVEGVEEMVEKGEKVEHYDEKGELIVEDDTEDEESGKGGDGEKIESPEENVGEKNKKGKIGDESDDDWVKVDCNSEQDAAGVQFSLMSSQN